PCRRNLAWASLSRGRRGRNHTRPPPQARSRGAGLTSRNVAAIWSRRSRFYRRAPLRVSVTIHPRKGRRCVGRAAIGVGSNMLKVCVAVALSWLLSGCAAAGLSIAGAGAGVAVGTGVEHTLRGVTYKTFTASADDVHWAARKALGRMEMTV